MFQIKRNAFTMLELTFVIVIIGILSAIAIPRFAATRDDAVIAKARTTVAAVRNSISAERQRRILRGDFTAITTLHTTNGIFDVFSADSQGNNERVLEYPMRNCLAQGKTSGCWQLNGVDYRYIFPDGATVDFTIFNGGNPSNRFDCVDATEANCRRLTQ